MKSNAGLLFLLHAGQFAPSHLAPLLVLEAQLVQLVFHKGHVCTCGQLEVQLSQQHGRL